MKQTTFTARQAAKETGKSVSTISRAIKSGRLSAKKSESGGYDIEAAELFRVFDQKKKKAQPVAQGVENTKTKQGATVASDNETQSKISLLELEIKFLNERLTDKDKLVNNHAETIDDLRARLDESQRQLAITAQTKTAEPAKDYKTFMLALAALLVAIGAAAGFILAIK